MDLVWVCFTRRLLLCASLLLLCLASLTKAEEQNQANRTIQEIIEEVSSQQNPLKTARECMNIFKSHGWGVKYGGKGWLKTPQNVSVPYEIPTKKDCVPRIIDMFLCHQCNEECLLDWIALHSECPDTKSKDSKEKIETLVKQGTLFSDLGHMLAKEIRSNTFGNVPAALHVEDCALKKMSITFSKDIRTEGIVFNVTKGLKDTTIFVIDGQDLIVSKCGLFQREKEWFCERVHDAEDAESTNDTEVEDGTMHKGILIAIPLLLAFIFVVVPCIWSDIRKLRGIDEERQPLLPAQMDFPYYLLPDQIDAALEIERLKSGFEEKLGVAFARILEEDKRGELIMIQTDDLAEILVDEFTQFAKLFLKKTRSFLKLSMSSEEWETLRHRFIDMIDQMNSISSKFSEERLHVLLKLQEEYHQDEGLPKGADLNEASSSEIANYKRKYYKTVIEAENRLQKLSKISQDKTVIVVVEFIKRLTEGKRLNRLIVTTFQTVAWCFAKWKCDMPIFGESALDWVIDSFMRRIFISEKETMGTDFTDETDPTVDENSITNSLIGSTTHEEEQTLRRRRGNSSREHEELKICEDVDRALEKFEEIEKGGISFEEVARIIAGQKPANVSFGHIV